MARIFISHSSVDDAKAVAVRDWLVANGWDDLFLDLDPLQGLKPGERWQEALKAAAHRCEVVIILISPAWAASRWCQAEFLLAKTLNKRLFGVLIEKTPFDDLPTEMTAEWHLADLTAAPTTYKMRVKEPRGTKTVSVSFSEDGLMRLKSGLEIAGLDPGFFSWPPEDDPDRPPYRGLRPLEAEDAGIFFGRDGAIVEALDALRGLHEAAPPRLFVILGASGAGKSSFLRAGLLPRLRRDAQHFLPLPVVRPERAVISGETGLVASLLQAFKVRGLPKTRADVRTAVAGGLGRMRTLINELADGAESLLLPIDQGEELFLAEGSEEAQQFLTLMAELLRGDGPAVIAVVTIRSDAYERLQVDERLDGIRQQAMSLAPMPKGTYAQVITGPAARLERVGRQLQIEEALVDALLGDMEAGGAKDTLPLLAFTLERLYLEYGGDGDLKLSEYEALGRIRGSIEAAVEGALRAADGDPKVPTDRQARLALLRRGLIPWLAGIDSETGEPRRRVARMSEIPEESRPLIAHLIEQRLLATDVSPETGEVTVEPAHEALLRQWGLLEGWLEEDFEALTILEGVKRAARDWEANGKGEAWIVHAGGRLEDAETVSARADLTAHLEPGERTYLAACRKKENEKVLRERRVRRRFVSTSLAAALVLALFGAFAGWQWFAAERARTETEMERNRALEAESLFLADLAGIQTGAGDPVTGMLLSLVGLPDENAEIETQRVRRHMPEAEIELYAGLHERRERAILSGHVSSVHSAEFSLDGSRIVTGSEDGTARLWDAQTGEETVVLRGHEDAVFSAKFSPDGTRIVTWSRDKTARLWDAATGAEIAVLHDHKTFVSAAEFSPDGTRILTGSEDRTVGLWDGETGALVHLFVGIDVNTAQFSPDGKRILIGSWDGTAQLWYAETGGEIALLRGHSRPVSTVQFSPDGMRILTGSMDGTARVWDAETGGEIAVFLGHERWVEVTAAQFSPDGSRIVTGSDDTTARVWNAQTGAEIAVLHGHEDRVTAVQFSPEGNRILTGSGDSTARLWNAETGVETAVLRGHASHVTAAQFSPDGLRILTGSWDTTARLWNAEMGVDIAVLHGHEGSLYSAEFSSDGSRIVTGLHDGTARIWDEQTGAEIAVLRGHGSVVTDAQFSPDGSRIITGSWDTTARLWDAQTGMELIVLHGHESPIYTAQFSPDGTRIVTGSGDNTARLWDSKTGTELVVLQGHESAIYTAQFSPDGTRVVTGSFLGVVRLWDAEAGVGIAILNGRQAGVEAAEFSPDGTRIVTGSRNGTARVWNAETGLEIVRLRGHKGWVHSAEFSPDGTRIVTGSGDGTARLWDGQTGAQIAVLRGHSGAVVAAAQFSPDGTRILIGSGLAVQLWTAFQTTQELVDHAKKGVPRCLTFEQRDEFHLSPEPPGWCIDMDKWPYDTDEWRAWLAERREGGNPQMPN